MNTERELLDRMSLALGRLVVATRDTLRAHPETSCCTVTREKCEKADAILAEYDALPPATADAPAKVAGEFQSRIAPWMQECFGPLISADRLERSDRFIEEALELVQACGYTQDRAHALVDYVFGRSVGHAPQEVGGVMVTLAALCLAHGFNMHAEGETELLRISAPEVIAKIRAKQAAKPTGSALPIPYPQTQPSAAGEGGFFGHPSHAWREGAGSMEECAKCGSWIADFSNGGPHKFDEPCPFAQPSAATAVNTAEGVCPCCEGRKVVVNTSVNGSGNPFTCPRCKGSGRASPPASASMSAGVTTALQQIRLIAGNVISGHTVPVNNALRLIIEYVDEIERARANTRAGVDWALDAGDVMADWCNRSGDALRAMMDAYERRIRTDCTPEQIAKKPWECAEYIIAQRVLDDKPGWTVAIPARTAGDAKGAEKPYSDTEAFGGGRLG